MVARAFHRLTPEGEEAPFVAVNCAAIPETLLEAELFGHEQGAFTGANPARKGVFEQALLAYDWPGNARELKHAVERGAILGNSAVVGPAVLFCSEENEADTPAANLADFIAQSEKRYISKALNNYDGHLGRTAGALGISRKNLWGKNEKTGIVIATPECRLMLPRTR